MEKSKRYIVAIDEGTTSTRAVLYDLEKGEIILQKSSPIKQIYPTPSFVEENANEIYAETLSSLVEILESAENLESIAGIGITNQRETVIAWDRKTGKPLYNAIVWQCRRTAEYMQELSKDYGDIIHQKTGLVMDAYFSASKIKWLIDNVPEINQKLKKDEVCFGTVDSFLVYKLTGGKSFVTDLTNASRTMLLNLDTLDYDQDLLGIFGIPKTSLPKIVACDEKVGYFEYSGVKIPLCGIVGDQQSAMVGQGCFEVGTSKVTYGTGLFMLYNLGYKPIISKNGLVTTVAYKINGKTAYAFEGSVFNAGSTVQWLRDNLGFFKSSKDSEALATSVEDNGGVYLVPAFTGLGAPVWNSEARGLISGLTRGATKAHITRAGLEAMAYSTKDLTLVMEEESGEKMTELRCDGGASANDFLMQFQSSVLGIPVNRPIERESTALGAVYLCGVGLGLFSVDEISKRRKTQKIFVPSGDEKYKKYYEGWLKAVQRSVL
ncbi:MAG: glycerol kinase GlpK [Clostridiales bacterium]|nr:glycerol kinase GlpK [Clostridiales bacterium]